MPRILALDYGERRLGFALSDPSGIIAMPLSVEEVHSDDQALKTVCRICRETEADSLVIGLPINLDGKQGPAAKKVQAFTTKLTGKLSIPVNMWDERLTTCMAERALLEADMRRARRKEVRDKVAAQIILQGYLDSISMDNQQI